jgi:hypothetical protein
MSDITFGTLGVPAPSSTSSRRTARPTAFPIQVDTLPDTLAGRDVLGRGKTGSGKTLAFSIPSPRASAVRSPAAPAAPDASSGSSSRPRASSRRRSTRRSSPWQPRTA